MNDTSKKRLGVLVSALVATAGIAAAQSAPEADPTGVLQKESLAQKEREKVRASNIKSVSVWRYAAADEKGTLVAKTDFDLTGHATVDSVLQQGRILKSTQNRFDAKGKVVETLRGQPGAQTRTTYDYDEAGKLKESVIYRANGAPLMDVKCVYDGQGKLSHMTTAIDRLSSVESTFEYTPDGKTKTLNMSGRFANGGSSSTVIRYADDNGTYEQKILDKQGNVIASKQSTIDKWGNPLQMVEMDAKGNVVRKLHSGLDANGNVVRQTIYGPDGKSSLDTTNTYDAQGNLTEKVTISAAGQIRTVWHYDAKGNKTEEIRYDRDGRVVETLKYVYEYFQS